MVVVKSTKKKARAKKKKAPTIQKYNTTIYQLQVKGPQRNKALLRMLEKLVDVIEKGYIATNSDYFGETVRYDDYYYLHKDPACIEIGIIKYNSIATGITWDTKSQKKNLNDPRVTAQVTSLFIYPLEHVAVLSHKAHGPNPAQVTSFLQKILKTLARELEIDVEIDVIPLKVAGTAETIRSWPVLKSLYLEIIRPNPDGRVRSKKIKKLLDLSDSDKIKLEFSAKTEDGLDKNGLKEYIDEAESLTSSAQGTIRARGEDQDGTPTEIDSKQTQVKKFPLTKASDDKTPLAKYFYEKLKSKFKIN